MGSGSVIDSSNDDASIAKANRKQLLADTGTAIEAATKQGSGQLAYSTDTSAGMKEGNYYGLDSAGNRYYKLYDQINFPLNTGTHMPYSGTFANNVTGIFSTASTTGSIALGSLDSTNGRGVTYTTGASAGNQAGFNCTNLFTNRSMNPALRFRFSLDTDTNIRFVLGFTNLTTVTPNNDDPFNASPGFAIGKTTVQGNFRILHNDSAGATSSDDTTVDADTGIHYIDLVADENNSRWYWNIDNGTATGFVTTDIPGSTNGLAVQATYTTTDAGANVMTLYQGIYTSHF